MTTERTEKTAAAAESAVRAALAADASAWDKFDPCLLLERLIIVGEKE